MENLAELIKSFKKELEKRKTDPGFDLIKMTEKFCKIEFYIEYLKNKVRSV